VKVNPFRTLKQAAVFRGTTIIRTGVKVRARQAVGLRTWAIGNVNVSDNDFSDDSENRRDMRFGGMLGVEYQALYGLGVRVDYRFQRRNSNVNRFDFYSNTFMVSIQGVL